MLASPQAAAVPVVKWDSELEWSRAAVAARTKQVAGSALASEVVGWAAAVAEAKAGSEGDSEAGDSEGKTRPAAEEADWAGAEGDWEVAGCV